MPSKCQRPAPNASASAIQTALQAPASFSETAWALRWKTPRSSASSARTKALNAIQTAQGMHVTSRDARRVRYDPTAPSYAEPFCPGFRLIAQESPPCASFDSPRPRRFLAVRPPRRRRPAVPGRLEDPSPPGGGDRPGGHVQGEREGHDVGPGRDRRGRPDRGRRLLRLDKEAARWVDQTRVVIEKRHGGVSITSDYDALEEASRTGSGPARPARSSTTRSGCRRAPRSASRTTSPTSS